MSNFLGKLRVELDNMKIDGLYKHERVITSVQDAAIKLDTGKEVLNLAQIIIWVYQHTPKWLMLPKKHLILTASVCHQFALFAVRRIYTKRA